MKRPGDIYILGFTKVGLLVFLFLSCATNYSGLKTQISPYLVTWSPLWVFCVLAGVFLIFALGPDYINSRTTRYVTRTFLQGEWKDKQSMIILVICACLVFYLTRYSYNMSQMSARAVVETVKGDAREKDTTPLDSIYRADLAGLSSGRETETGGLTEKYNRLIEAEAAPFNTKIEREETRIADLGKSNVTNKASKIRGARSNIAYYQSLIAKVESKYREQERGELAEIENRYNRKDSLLTVIYLSNRDTTLLRNSEQVVMHDDLKTYLKNEIGSIAGLSVYFYLLLSVMLEIVYFRNDMHPNPIYTPFDFKPSAILEVLALPFVASGRRIFNAARKKYNNLPEVIERKDWKEVTDQGEIQKVKAKQVTHLPYQPAQLNGHAGKKKRGLKPETDRALKTETKDAETGETPETTDFQVRNHEFETLKGILGQIDKPQRSIHTRIWKINHNDGRPETNRERMQEACQQIVEIIARYTKQIQHNDQLVNEFESLLHEKGTYASLQKAKDFLEETATV